MFYFIVDIRGEGKKPGWELKLWKNVQRKLKRLIPEEDKKVFYAESYEEAGEYARIVTEQAAGKKNLIVVGRRELLCEVVDGSRLDGDDVYISFISKGRQNLVFGKLFGNSLKKRLKNIVNSENVLFLNYGVLDSEAGHRRFISSAGIGFEGAFLNGKIRSAFKFIKGLLRFRRTKGYVILDGERRLEFNNICFISLFLDSFKTGRKSGQNGEGMELCLLSTRHRTRLLRFMFSYAKTRSIHKNLAGRNSYRLRSADIHLDEPMQVFVDGVPLRWQQDISVQCIPGKLKMV